MSDGIARAALWGEDHTELGEVATAAAGPRAALALTRGRHAKAYRYEDPNEDVVAAVSGPAGTLLVCADGHSGALASHLGVRALLERLPEPPEAIGDKAWLEHVAAVNDAIVAAKTITCPQPASETVLLAALVTPGRLSFAAIGDAALVVARPGDRGRQVNKEAARYLGRAVGGRALKGAVHRGSLSLGREDWVVLATDGLSSFIDPLKPADLVPRLLDPAAGAAGAARAVVDAAGDAGAGDNVGVVVLAPA